MPTATRVMLSRALKRNLPRHKLLVPQQRGLAAHVDEKAVRPGDRQPVHEVLKNASFNTHHPVSTAVSWGEEFWRKVPVYSDVSSKEFLSYRWSVENTIDANTTGKRSKLWEFLKAVLPDEVPNGAERQSKQQLIDDIFLGIMESTMAVRITPYLLSRINWQDPRNDPIFRQFIPLKSILLPDHPKVKPDSLHEEADMPARGLVHRYPDKALFLAVSVCPTYCIYCTREYAIGADTATVTKKSFKPGRRRWDEVFTYIEANPQLQDIVVSGGDSFYLSPEQIRYIAGFLISVPHIRRFRFASKGLAVAPMRFLDQADDWVDALIEVSQKTRDAGKSMALHTHFNHPNEISWITKAASQKLHAANVRVRNQTVLLKDINDDVQTMSMLIRELADNHIDPYYLYMCDMVPHVEHFRTPLQTLLDLESHIRGSIAGYQTPQFIVDLPGGGGKRPGSTYASYDRETGVSTFKAPSVTGAAAARGGREKPKLFEYYDPIVHDVRVNLKGQDQTFHGWRGCGGLGRG